MKESNINTDNNNFSRRAFLRNCTGFGLGCFVFNNMDFSENLLTGNTKELNNSNTIKLHKADYWKSLGKKITQCELCPNGCTLAVGENGNCHSRGNRDGEYYSLVYGLPAIIALDNIEKSPLYHYQIKDKAFSIATSGCNLHCNYCQNSDYSQVGPDEVKTYPLEPADVIARAKKNGVNAINFFYTEPTIYFEYMRDIAVLAKKENMKTFCVTAGSINEEPLNELIPLIDAFVFGLKGFDKVFYTKYIHGELEPIKNSLKILAKNKDKTWFEIVNLLVTDLNVDDTQITAMCKWIKEEIGIDVPLHFTRFEPYYKMKDFEPTPISSLSNAYQIAKDIGLQYVYTGNLPGNDGCNTYCPKCRKTLIERVDFDIIKNITDKGKCSCGHQLPGYWL